MGKFEQTFGHIKIRLKTLEAATEEFHKDYVIGSGGYGVIFQGSIPKYNTDRRFSGHPIERKPVAIKRRNGDSEQQILEFQSEIIPLTYLKHQNIISLIGYCDEDGELSLVYQYAPNKSLDSYMKTQSAYSNITWAQRIKICRGVARGLEYLHSGGNREMSCIHRDIKSANILLDKNWQPMISDFGLSVKKKSNSMKLGVAGTDGYIDPYYKKTNSVSEKVDVYSFGVFLSEVLSGELIHRRDPQYEIKIKEDFDLLKTFTKMASRCQEYLPNNRPDMKDIVKEIEKLLENQIVSLNLRMHLEDIKKATNNFDDSNIIGWGESARVYKGELSAIQGSKQIAVKRYKHRVEDETDIMTDILRLTDFKHENIIDFLGFYNHNDEKFLVYEYASNGSLDKYLNNTSNKIILTWKESLKICLGAAQGLYFIHTSEIVHGDVKSSNILLTCNLTAKISNFGWYKRTHKNGITFLVTSGAGTLGYCDPGYMATGTLSKASDVYSFGIVLFEVFNKCLVLENDRHNDDQQLDVSRKLNKKVEVNKYGNSSLSSVSTFLNIALQCVHKNPKERPSIGQVVEQLIKASNLETEEWECKN